MSQTKQTSHTPGPRTVGKDELVESIRTALKLLDVELDTQDISLGHTNLNHAHAELSYILTKATGGAK